MSSRLLFVANCVFILVANCIDLCTGGSYCVYLHEDYYTYRQIYCESGCCSDYGEEDEICCFSWTIGVILGIGFACVGFIGIIIFAVICCNHMKKRSGHVIHPQQPYPQNNTVVYTAASAPPYPYPPGQPGYYPAPPYPGYAPGALPPPYTAGTQPAYMPTRLDQSNDANRQQPDAQAHRHAHSAAMNPPDPVYPPNMGQPYNGYGQGDQT